MLKEMLRAWLIYTRDMIRGGIYKFSFNDVNLHWKERTWILPEMTLIAYDGELKCFEIYGKTFYWPSRFESNALPWLYNEVFYPRSKNPSSYDHPIATPEGGWVIDCGACEGFFSMFAFEKGAKKVIAVEPLASMTAALEKTFSNEVMEKRFDVVSNALGKGIGETTFDVLEEKAYDSKISFNNKGRMVLVKTIDSIIKDYNLEGQGFIKMDIEGAEMEALQGTKEVLKEMKPKLAIAVYHGYENALQCREIILNANPEYRIEFRGMYGWFSPPRPYMLFAY